LCERGGITPVDFDKVKLIVEQAALQLADEDELAALVDMTLDEFRDYAAKYPQLNAIIDKNKALGRNSLRSKFWDRALSCGEYKPMRDLAIKHLGFGDTKNINLEMAVSKESEFNEDQLRLISKIVTLDSAKIDEVNRLLA
jgi:hypothetical protein